jgi:hypothetical protein
MHASYRAGLGSGATLKKLLLFSLVALVAVVGLGLYSMRVMGEFARRDRELRELFDARAKDLAATDALFAPAAGPALDPVRFPAWLEVRGEIARAFAARAAEASGNAFHAMETRSEMLVLLKAALVERKMAFAEYRATAGRWRALLALPEFAPLQEAWRRRTATKGRPEGLALPPPAPDALEKELELIRRYARLLEESMDADLLDPLLEKIGRGPGEG